MAALYTAVRSVTWRTRSETYWNSIWWDTPWRGGTETKYPALGWYRMPVGIKPAYVRFVQGRLNLETTLGKHLIGASKFILAPFPFYRQLATCVSRLLSTT